MVINQEITDRYAIYNADCIEVFSKIPDNSIHMWIFSPPFAGLYHYSSSERDMSNCKSYEEFMVNYEFLVKEQARTTMPGRICSVHCMDVPKLGANICGYIDFPGDLIKLYDKYGFECFYELIRHLSINLRQIKPIMECISSLDCIPDHGFQLVSIFKITFELYLHQSVIRGIDAFIVKGREIGRTQGRIGPVLSF